MSARQPRPIVDLSTPAVMPEDEREFARCLADPMWRLRSGMYKIMVKGDEDDPDAVDTILNFTPNAAQARFLLRMHYRNVILKARQLGYTTLICILWLDHALFNSNQRCTVVAHNMDAAESIFRDKVKFAYVNLPPTLLAMFPLARDSASEVLFAHNNSNVKVTTSARSGTTHRLLVSEFGKICATNPRKAKEVITGSIPSVPLHGITVIESTAEGQAGEFFNITKKAQAKYEQRKALTPRDYRFHFAAWWMDPKYRMDPTGVLMTDEDHAYFDSVEVTIRGTGQPLTLDIQQRAWYVSTRDNDFSGNDEDMWQEYPSFPDEAFQVSTEGTYYAKELARARKEGRICHVPYMPGLPVNTFWDIGLNDQQVIWCHQRVGLQDRFINYYENVGEAPAHYKKWLDDQNYNLGWHYLPHDGNKRTSKTDSVVTYKSLMEEVGFRNIEVVPRIESFVTGVQMVRNAFPAYYFDETKCKEGLARLALYRKQWNDLKGIYTDQHVHDENSNAADAIRQHAQGFKPRGGQKKPKRSATSWRAQ